MSSAPSTPEAPWHAGLRGARANVLPGLALQIAALALVIAYYRHPGTHAAVHALADLHDRAGFTFSIISTGLFGGVIPLLYLKAYRATRSRFTWAGGTVLIAFWSYKGFEVDLWYRLLAHFVGEKPDFTTIAIKTILDQFVYCPIFAVPVTVLIYSWVETSFSMRPIFADIRAGRWYQRRVLPVLISNLGVWVPAVCIIYALPTALQLPLQNLVLCFFTLLLAHVMTGKEVSRDK
jgi:hypothetical protein